jgi:hypothetical protein
VFRDSSKGRFTPVGYGGRKVLSFQNEYFHKFEAAVVGFGVLLWKDFELKNSSFAPN